MRRRKSEGEDANTSWIHETQESEVSAEKEAEGGRSWPITGDGEAIEEEIEEEVPPERLSEEEIPIEFSKTVKLIERGIQIAFRKEVWARETMDKRWPANTALEKNLER